CAADPGRGGRGEPVPDGDERRPRDGGRLRRGHLPVPWGPGPMRETMLIHVSPHGDDRADGSEEHPVATIGRGAELAQPGDTVIVREGVYREWVSPPRGGLSDNRRITYTAAPGDKVVIKGSEVDRKSTRLNSSHVKISYAVFCLKKKNGDSCEA